MNYNDDAKTLADRRCELIKANQEYDSLFNNHLDQNKIDNAKNRIVSINDEVVRLMNEFSKKYNNKQTNEIYKQAEVNLKNCK